MVAENYIQEDGTYSYTVDYQMSLMATYPVFREITSTGYKDARVRMVVLSSPAEKELYKLIQTYGSRAESYLDASDRLTTNGYIVLEEIVKLMIKYPNLRLEVAVHTDNSGSPDNNIYISLNRAKILVNYLVNRGISASRLTANGYGGTRPITSGYTEKDRSLNRRIDFMIMSSN
jgi:outer membrane protein OmpA-like peptidoglycan-associated protein